MIKRSNDFMPSSVRNVGTSGILVTFAVAILLAVSSWFGTQAVVVPQLKQSIDGLNDTVDKIETHTGHAHDDIENHIKHSTEYVGEMRRDIAINAHKIEKLEDNCKDNSEFIRSLIRAKIKQVTDNGK